MVQIPYQVLLSNHARTGRGRDLTTRRMTASELSRRVESPYSSMFSVDEIRDARLDGPIEVSIADVSVPSNSKVDVVVTVADSDGVSVELDVWTTHDLRIDWTVGRRYELRDVRGKVWHRDGTRHRRLSSTSDLDATDLGPHHDDQCRLLVVGDTHVGYHARPPESRVSAHRGVDCRASFERVVEIALGSGVDAVVHAGDVFDDQPLSADVAAVETALGRLRAGGIPFYYILGNHESTTSTRRLEAVVGSVHLTTVPSVVGESNVALFGIDYHRPIAFPSNAFDATAPPGDRVNVLVVHQTFAPFRSSGIDLVAMLRRSAVEFDLVVSGHLHVAEERTVGGVPVFYTGATDRISRIGSSNDPSARIVSVAGTDVDVSGQPL